MNSIPPAIKVFAQASKIIWMVMSLSIPILVSVALIQAEPSDIPPNTTIIYLFSGLAIASLVAALAIFRAGDKIPLRAPSTYPSKDSLNEKGQELYSKMHRRHLLTIVCLALNEFAVIMSLVLAYTGHGLSSVLVVATLALGSNIFIIRPNQDSIIKEAKLRAPEGFLKNS